MSDTIAKLKDLLLSQSKAGRLRELLDSIYGAASTGAEAYGAASSPMSEDHSGMLGGLLMDFSPLGDAKSAYDGLNAARQGDYLGAALGGLGALPMVPNLAGAINTSKIANSREALKNYFASKGQKLEFSVKPDKYDENISVQALLNGKPIGWLGASKVEDAGVRFNPSVEVDEAYRRLGVGSSLYDVAIKNGALIPDLKQTGQARSIQGQRFREAIEK